LGLLTVYPFRCQLCTHRFLAFLWRYSAIHRREYDRVPAQYPVTLYPASAQKEDEGLRGTTVNLSITGCLVETDAHVPQGTSVRVKIHGSGLDSPIEVEGATVRAVMKNQLGLEFFKIAPAEEKRLRVFMEAHLLCRPRANRPE
jgi:c-di-GMP-binding flagellar brake protein YcgR